MFERVSETVWGTAVHVHFNLNNRSVEHRKVR